MKRSAESIARILAAAWLVTIIVIVVAALFNLNDEHSKHFSKPPRDHLRITTQTITNEGCWFVVFRLAPPSGGNIQALHHPACPNHHAR